MKHSQGCVKQSQGCVKQSQGCVKQSQGCVKHSQGCAKHSQGCVKHSQPCAMHCRSVCGCLRRSGFRPTRWRGEGGGVKWGANDGGGAGGGLMHQAGACCTALGLLGALAPPVFREKPPGTMPAMWLLPAGSVVAGGIASANDGGTRESGARVRLQPRCSNPTLIRVPRGP